MYSLRNDYTVVIKGADKGSGVPIWDREDYLKEVLKQMSDEEVYEEVTNDPSTFKSTIFTTVNNIRAPDICLLTIWNICSIRNLNFICYQKFINGYIMFMVDQ